MYRFCPVDPIARYVSLEQVSKPTAIGSSIESGDEGLAGRGNRINGLITPLRPMSMEGSYGKNPVYHIGKVYYLQAFLISKKVYKCLKIPNIILLISQSEKDIKNPWIVAIKVPPNVSQQQKDKIKEIVIEELDKMKEITDFIIKKNYLLKRINFDE